MTILKMTAEDYTLSAEYLGPMLEALQKRGIDEQEALAGPDIEPGCARARRDEGQAVAQQRPAQLSRQPAAPRQSPRAE